MYNKLFTKILDSSIWLAPMPTRIVWITFLAAMDEDGFVQLAAVGNVARRANVSMEEAESALAELESPDPNSPPDEYQGRRVERVPGGWLVLKAKEHRQMVTRAVAQDQARERMRRYRERLRKRDAPVTPSEAVSESESESERASTTIADRFARFYEAYPRKKAPKKAQLAFKAIDPDDALLQTMLAAIERQKRSRQWQDKQFIPFPATWLNQRRWEDEAEAEGAPRASAAPAPTYQDTWTCEHEPPCPNRDWHAMKLLTEF